MKVLIIYCQILTIIAATYIVMVQEKVLKFDDPAKEALFFNISIPCALVFMCLSIQVGFTAVVQSAFQDERVMPFNKKATGINIIVLVSKSCTIGAPFVNELEEPIPIVVIIVLAVISIVIVSFFKSKEELDQMKKIDTSLQGMMSAASRKDENEKLLPIDKL